MQLELIIAALKQRCNVFTNRVAGAARFKILPEASALDVPCAFVLPLDDNPGESRAINSVRQNLTDSFAVVVALSNTLDEKGQAAAGSVNALRTVLWSALLGWRPTDSYNGIVYQGGSLLSLDRARIWYQFEFAADMEITPADGWQDTELAGLPHFDAVDMDLDWLEPFDPNLAATGPDGRIDQIVPIPKTGVLPT